MSSSSSSSSSPNWADLFYEGLVCIFGKVGFEELYHSLPLVCKNWRLPTLDPLCWVHIDMTTSFQKRLEASNSSSPPPWWQLAFVSKMDHMIQLAVDRSFGNLLELRTRHCSDSAILYLAERCPQLKCISIAFSPNVTDKSIIKIAEACPKLEHVDLSQCPSITQISLLQLGLKCNQLTTLERSMINTNYSAKEKAMLPSNILHDFLSSTNVDEEAQTISDSFMQRLKVLVLRYTQLSDEGLQSIIQGCPSLEYLDLCGSSNLTRRALDHAGNSLKNLKAFYRPQLIPASNHLYGGRFGQWPMPINEYRGACHFPIPSIGRSLTSYTLESKYF